MKKFTVYRLLFTMSTGICIFLVILSGVEGFAQNASDTSKSFFSLKQAIDYAMQNQHTIKNALLDEQIAENKVKEIVGIGLPQINGSFDVKDFIEIPTSLIPGEIFGAPPGTYIGVKFGTKYSSSVGIDASQLIFSSDYLVGLQATKTYLDLTKKATQRTKIETSVAVTKAYYSVLLNEERMKLVEDNVTRLKKLMDDTQILNANGFAEKIDLDRITVTYNNLLVEKEKIHRMMDLGIALLKFQMGMQQTVSLTLTDKLADVKLDVTSSADKVNYPNRIEYSLLETQRNAAKLQLKKDKLSYLPNMALYGAINANAYRQEFNIFDTKKSWYPTEL
ncbi:MAG: TolC family protein, partial [Bacteroidota bacterium]